MSSIDRSSILFDATSLRNVFTGLGQFSHHLVEEFTRDSSKDFDISYLIHPSSRNYIEKYTKHWVKASWLKRHVPRRLLPALFPTYDLWHVVAENTRFTFFPKHTTVLLTLHGLHFLDENTPDVAKRKLQLVQQLVDKSHALATVSAYTENLVRKHLDIGQKPLRIIHHGVGNYDSVSVVKPTEAPLGKFLFSIGNFFDRKNFHVLIPFLGQLEGYSLVLAGNHRNHYGDFVKKEVGRLGLNERVFFLGEIGDAEKYWLYQNCHSFVFPSFSEGFGIPIIEAMKAGKPVFCSQLGSLPEIGSKHAYYWENLEAEYMKNFFLENSKSFYQDKENAIRNREYADRFTWRKAAESYLSYYADLTK